MKQKRFKKLKSKLKLSVWRYAAINYINRYIFKNTNVVFCNVMSPSSLSKKRQPFVFGFDYIRTSSLELIANEIYEKNIVGNVAELGVYKGMFAACINMAFPDRKLYLFDTFEGFDARDLEIETIKGYSKGCSTIDENFSNTSVELVLSKMVHKENCIIKKGYFPETIDGINEKFAFVSIDADLYEPIYQGLNYFYDNLSEGGYIMLHDYNNIEFTGAKAALRKFSEERKVPFYPLCDVGGSAIIMK